MRSYDEAVLAWAKDYIRGLQKSGYWENINVDTDVVVASVDWETGSDGYCDTCYYEWNDSVLRFKMADGNEYDYRLYMEFGDVTRALFNYGQVDV